MTIYWTEPADELLGFVNTWLIVVPDPIVAPVMPPELVPSVQEKLLGIVAANAMFGLVPLQIVAVDDVVTTGAGFTVTVIVSGIPGHVPVVAVGVTI